MSIQNLEDVFTYLHPLLDPANFESDTNKFECNVHPKREFVCDNIVTHVFICKCDSLRRQLLACDLHKLDHMVPIGEHLCKYKSKYPCKYFARYYMIGNDEVMYCKKHIGRFPGIHAEIPPMTLNEARNYKKIEL